MTRAYHLIRYIPDPVRGEMVNIAIVALVDDSARVMALPAVDIVKRAFRIAPHVDAANAVAFVAELSSSSGNVAAVRQLLDVFDPHYRIEEPRRLSSSVELEATLASAFRELVAQPAKRRKNAGGKWTIQKAIDSISARVPSFSAQAKRKVSVREHPEMFGLDSSLFEAVSPPDLPPFDAVVPNCVRVLALRGLVVGEQMHASTFFETQAELHTASAFFEARLAPSKNVITGALLLPHAKEQVSLATRDGMRGGLTQVVGQIDVEGLPRRHAVFDLSNPTDERYLEQLSVILSRGQA
jgi:hypothetical protein